MEEVKRRKRVRTVYYKRLAIWFYPCEWEKINYLAAGQGMTVSRYISEKVKASTVVCPEDVERDKSKKGFTKVLAFDETEYPMILEKIEKSGQKVTRYLINIMFS